ncbi:MAG: hypothetical protein KAV83_01690 [Desulfobacterales bacterium]|nr:hypothetical protein [Desulfobacterales bacterium]
MFYEVDKKNLDWLILLNPQSLAQTLAQTGIIGLIAYNKLKRQGGPGL